MKLLQGSLYQVVNLVFQIYIFIVVARILISWVGPASYHPVVNFLCRATDPVLDRLRRLLPLQFGGLDLTPVVLLMTLYLLKDLLLNLIAQYGHG